MKFVKIEVFIPKENTKKLMEKINKGGFLKEENYDFCYAETPVIGHFRPIEGANPYIGSLGKIEDVLENKVEFRIRREDLSKVMKIIKENHPYEVPVINVIELNNS
ncbi:divalent cation tolerance protein CutA [Peptoniphilus sp. AGMB00490]|uniref:Divalent cation tolerance protein CutA n=2 Tax=Peptoniphilus TaxID=162289 RepID=A0ACD6AZL8_9FIRM|nr:MULTISPECIES: divalent cation tolerance protein CutA [Peptoniphilus]NMW86146.1 divalent cation tolerance protein CutA [Peptoniphilus faecalis]OLR65068.1 hypothetical protein BIV18_05845 [Peptoniphilus porci]